MNPIKPVYVAVAPDELQALNQVVETLNEKFAELGADLEGKTTLDRLFELAKLGLEVERLMPRPCCEPALTRPLTGITGAEGVYSSTEHAPKQAIKLERKFEECVYLIHFTDEESRVRHIRELMAKLDGGGWRGRVDWNEAFINDPISVFLMCYKEGYYNIYNHDCGFKEKGFPLRHWCGADPTKHRPKVKVGDRVVATTVIPFGSSRYLLEGFAWKVSEVDEYYEPILPNGTKICWEDGYRLATKYDQI